jgi:hypothetical protein
LISKTGYQLEEETIKNEIQQADLAKKKVIEGVDL